jgi:hypothetical protein
MGGKVRENRIRRKLDRMGYRLVRSRRKDPDARDYGKYTVVDLEAGGAVFGQNPVHGRAEATLDEVEQWIRERTGGD